jgi:GAF domain-containing protein
MTDQTDLNTDAFLKIIAEAASKADSLDTALEQIIRGLKKYGVKLPVDHKSLMDGLRSNLKETEKNAQQVTGKLHQFQKLVHTSALITSSLELDRVLEEVMDTIIDLTGAERAYLMLWEKSENQLKIRAARNWDGANLSKEEVSFSRSIMNTAYETGKPVLTTNAQMDSRFSAAESVVMNTLRSIVCVPLVLRGQSIGVLYIDNRMRDAVFNQDHLPMLTTFASQAAIAIENARLFEKVKADLDEAQHQVQELVIQIDRQKLDNQLKEIVDSDLFKRLKEQIRRDQPGGAEKPA